MWRHATRHFTNDWSDLPKHEYISLSLRDRMFNLEVDYGTSFDRAGPICDLSLDGLEYRL